MVDMSSNVRTYTRANLFKNYTYTLVAFIYQMQFLEIKASGSRSVSDRAD